MSRKSWCVIFVLILIVLLVEGTLGPDDKKKKTKIKKPPNQPKKSNPEFSRPNTFAELVKQDIDSTDEILVNYNGPLWKPEIKQFNGNVLGYVTPWNSHGYDVSKQFANKIDLNSPVWLQIKRSGQFKYDLSGTHDIDASWMKAVRSARKDSPVKIVPRILFEKLKMEDVHALFNVEEEKQALAKMLLAKANQYDFDGYVFEIYLQLGGQGKTEINHLVVDITETLHSAGKLLLLVIPPPIKNLKDDDTSSAVFDREDFEMLKDVVDGFSLMTYDFATHNSIMGANAPLEWVERNALYFVHNEPESVRAKLLLGLNFYGIKYNLIDHVQQGSRLKSQPEPITGTQFIEWMKSSQNEVKIIFDESSQEHVYIDNMSATEKTFIFFPSLFSIHKRIELAEKLGIGLSIWELGQGLDYFYDLL